MGRKTTDSEIFSSRINPRDRQVLSDLVIALGFKYKRNKAFQPNWVDFYSYLAERSEALKAILPNLAKDVDKDG